MRPNDPPEAPWRLRRRQALVLPLALSAASHWSSAAGQSAPPAGAGAAPAVAAVESALRTGGVVIGIRHALAPGTFDPPGFRLGDCSTQRNLNDEGRAQARRLGQWFRERSLVPAAVRTSPWCRCVDTAELAFGAAQTWPALGSPVGSTEAVQGRHLVELRQAVADAARRPGRFEAWVTHMFVLRDLAGVSVAVGEGVVLAPRDGRVAVIARLVVD